MSQFGGSDFKDKDKTMKVTTFLERLDKSS